MLREDFLLPLGITPGTLAVSLGLSRSYVSKLLHGQRKLLGNTDSIKDLSPDIRERVVGAYVKHEANGEVPEYQGKAEKLHDPKHHAYIHLCNCLRRGWLK